MDYHDPIDLEGLPSDAFDTEDIDNDQPRVVADSSSWTAESSPVPADDEEAEYSDPDLDELSGLEDEEDHDSQEDDEFEGQDDEENDTDNDDLPFELEDEDAYEFVLGGEDAIDEFWTQGPRGWHFGGDSEEEESDERPSPSPRAGRRFADIFTELHAHRDDDDDSLFVDQGPNILPPLEALLSSVRRNHARALDLVSDLHSRNLGQERGSRGSFGGAAAAAGPARENHRQNHRHHPYGVSQGRGRERARMNDNRNGGSRDELVEVEVQSARAGTNGSRSPPLGQPEIIDLTGEPDSPEIPRAIVPPRARASNAPAAGRNPRRQTSLNQRTPSLSRSDGSILGNQTNVIDLTLDDSPAPPPLPQQLPRRNNPNNPPHHRHHHHHPHRRRDPGRTQSGDLDNQGGFSARVAGLIRNLDFIQRLGLGRPHEVEVQLIGGSGLNMADPLAGNVPNLDYRVNGGHAGTAPKPDHVPPPPAREGFTRDTGNPEDVVICPSCEQELKYDPDAGDEDGMRPNKKPRTRKDQEEHHFWALKDCGHVYCKACYENRRVGSKNSAVHFRRDPENNRKNLCAVEGCTSEANNKSNWVGLFL